MFLDAKKYIGRKIDKVKCENVDRRNQSDLLKSRIERMEENKLKWIKKCHERRIRDLFLIARRRVSQELKIRKLPQNTLGIIYGSDIMQISNQYPLLLELLHDVSAEFQINEN